MAPSPVALLQRIRARRELADVEPAGFVGRAGARLFSRDLLVLTGKGEPNAGGDGIAGLEPFDGVGVGNIATGVRLDADRARRIREVRRGGIERRGGVPDRAVESRSGRGEELFAGRDPEGRGAARGDLTVEDQRDDPARLRR